MNKRSSHSGLPAKRTVTLRTRAQVVVLLALFVGTSVHAYHKDSHYYLRFTLSLTTCFDWTESHYIASGDWGLDENARTHAEMNPVQRFNKINWHAFGHSDQRFRELWVRSLEEPDLEMRLIKLGQFMHFLEDWEAHAGYGVRLGHARDTFRGRDPDSLGNSQAKNHRMIQSALDHLLATCQDLGRLDSDRDRRLIEIMLAVHEDQLPRDLYDASDPSWKKGKTGGLRPEGDMILLANKTRLEQFIESHVRPRPGKNIPEDFAPGTENGIPPSLSIPFDQDGGVSDLRTDLEAYRELAAAERSADVTLNLEEAEAFSRGRGPSGSGGWRMRVTAFNLGDAPSKEGSIEIVVVDSEDESAVAQASEPLPSLSPGESRAFQFVVGSTSRPEGDVIIGAFARVSDLSATNDEDWLMLGDAEEEEPEVPDTTDVDPQPAGPETTRFLAPPKTMVVGSQACILVTALVSGGDSTEKLDVGNAEVVGGALKRYEFEQSIPSRWSALATDSGLVGGKTFACFVPEPAAIEKLAELDAEKLEIAVTLEADNVEPHTEVFPMDIQFYEDILRLGGSAPTSGMADN